MLLSPRILSSTVFGLAILFFVIAPGSAFAQQQITVYSECNYQGRPATIGRGLYSAKDLADAGVVEDSISSIVVPPGLSATLYSDDNFAGRSGVLRDAIKCLDADRFNNIISSLTVQPAGQEEAAAAAAEKRVQQESAAVTLYPDCRYQGPGIALSAGEYTLAKLQRLGMANNSVSSIRVPAGYEIAVYENDFFRGQALRFQQSDQCLRDNDMNDKITSVVVGSKNGLGGSTVTQIQNQTQTNQGQSGQDQLAQTQSSGSNQPLAIEIYSECNYKGIGVRLAPGKYQVGDLEDLGMPNNAISSVRVPRGLKASIYENDFFRGDGAVLQSDEGCLIGAQLNDKVSSIIVERGGLPQVSDQSGTLAGGSSSSTAAGSSVSAADATAALYSQCGFRGSRVLLKDGEYTAEQLHQMGFKDNSLSSLKVADGHQVELFFYDFFRGKSGYLRADDDCLTNDGFDNEVSSIKVTRIGVGGTAEEDKPLTQVDGGQRAATVYQHCSFKGGNVALTPGRYTQDALRQLGIGNDVISSLKVQEGYQVQLYDNGQLRGRPVVVNADDDCLDDNNMLNRVSSLVITQVRQPPRPSSDEQRAAMAAALEAGIDCVALYAERNICDARRWPDIVQRCNLEEVPAMTDGYLKGHVEAGNCIPRYWDDLSKRIRNPALR